MDPHVLTGGAIEVGCDVCQVAKTLTVQSLNVETTYGTGTPPLWNGAMAAVMQMLYQSVVMKREPRLKVKLRNCHSLPSSTVWSQALSRDQISEITDMSFLHRVAGPTLRDRVRSSVIQQRQSRSPTLDSSTSKTTQDTGPHCKRGL